ncbi:hypothetical protein TSOC_000973, partial [Tetrabaena socialis]
VVAVVCEVCDREVDVEGFALRDDQAQQLVGSEMAAARAGGEGQAASADGAAMLRMMEAMMGEQKEALASLSAQVGGVQGAIVSKMDGVQAALDSRLQGVQGALGGQLSEMAAAAAESQADVVRRVLALHKGVAGLDAKPMPTLHVILPEPSSERAWCGRARGGDVKGLVKARFRLHLLCEHTGGPHMTNHDGYEIERPKQFLRKYAPGLRVLSHAAGLLLGSGVRALTGGATDDGLGRLGQMVDQHVLDEPLTAFEKMNKLLDKLQLEGDDEVGVKGAAKRPLPPPPPPPTGSSAAEEWQVKHQMEFEGCQEARREIQLLIQRQDPMCRYGNLQKVAALSGDVLWLCKDHTACHAGAFKLR